MGSIKSGSVEIIKDKNISKEIHCAVYSDQFLHEHFVNAMRVAEVFMAKNNKEMVRMNNYIKNYFQDQDPNCSLFLLMI